MPACKECNQGTSTADLVAAIVSRWNVEQHEQELTDHARLVSRLRRTNPAIIEEWTKFGVDDRARAFERLRKHGVAVPADASLVPVGKDTICLINLFAYKIALGLYFEHFREPLPNSGFVCAIWRTKEDLATAGFPKEILDMMPQYASLQQGKWDTREQFEYRFAINQADGLFGCVARFRTSLFITGFAITNGELLPADEGKEWIRPNQLLSIAQKPEFKKRLQ